MRRYTFVFVVLFFLTVSCSNEKGQKQLHVKEIDFTDVPNNTLAASSIDLEVPGLLDIFCLKDAVLLRTRDAENLFYVLDMEDQHIVGTFGQKGNGPLDFLYPRNFTPADSSSLWITDIGLKRIYRVFTPSIESPDRVSSISSVLSFRDDDREVNYMVDDEHVFGIVRSHRDSTTFFLQNISSGDQTDSTYLTFGLPKKYDELSVDQKSVYSQKSTAIKPDGSKMVLAHYFSPYITVVSTKGELRQTVSVEHLNKNTKINNKNFEKELCAIFDGIAATDKYIYVVYNGQSNDEVAEVRKPIDVLVFDWELNPVRRFTMDEYILRIGVSYDDKFLIGVDYTNEEVFKYQLP